MIIHEYDAQVVIANDGGASYSYEGTVTIDLRLKDSTLPSTTLERAIRMLDSICDQFQDDQQSVTISGILNGIDNTDPANPVSTLLYTWTPSHPR